VNPEKTATSRWRRVLRFSLGTLLFIVLLVAGFLGGMRAGFHRGYSAGQSQRAKETPVARVYPVASLVLPTADASPSEADFDTLIEVITTSIAPESWDEVGGPGSIDAFPLGLSLVVTQTPEIHERITVLLNDLEGLRGAADAASDDSVSAPDSKTDH
jgi:hypothetical protein